MGKMNNKYMKGWKIVLYAETMLSDRIPKQLSYYQPIGKRNAGSSRKDGLIFEGRTG
jgi:hypothetical protein